MKLTIKDKEYNLRLLCGKVRELRDAIKSDDLLGALSKAAPENDVETLAKALRVMCVDPRLSKDSEVYQIIDDYLEEDHTVIDFGNVIMEVLDDSGFLPYRGMSEEIRKKTETALKEIDGRLTDLPTQEFAGYKG